LTPRAGSCIHWRAHPTADGFFGGNTEDPMLTASHIATALSAATGRFHRPGDRLPVGALGYWVAGMNMARCGQRSTLRPE
jgi:hypothetical protein